MRNIRLFNEYNEFLAVQEAVSGSGNYVEDIFPGFAYVKDHYSGETFAYYNGHEAPEGYKFGEVVYLASDNTLKSVYWTGYNENLGPKVGLIVVPTSHAEDGNARMIAFQNVSGVSINEASGDAYDYLFTWNGTDNQGYKAEGVICWDFDKVTSNPYRYYMSERGDFPSDNTRGLLNPMSETEWMPYSMDDPDPASGQSDYGYYFVVSPYLSDGSQNERYLDADGQTLGPGGNIITNALADWNGYANTQNLQGEDAANSVLAFSTTGTNAGDWYLGAMGELGYVAARFWAISYIMQQLGGDNLLIETQSGSYISHHPIYSSTETPSTSDNSPFLLCYSPMYYEETTIDEPGEAYPEAIALPTRNDIAHLYPYPDYNWNSQYRYISSVRPMAMIKDGQIQHPDNS